MDADFDTDSLRYRANERHLAACFNPRAIWGTAGSPADEAPPLIRYIAKRMALVATPYWPCTDL